VIKKPLHTEGGGGAKKAHRIRVANIPATSTCDARVQKAESYLVKLLQVVKLAGEKNTRAVGTQKKKSQKIKKAGKDQSADRNADQETERQRKKEATRGRKGEDERGGGAERKEN